MSKPKPVLPVKKILLENYYLKLRCGTVSFKYLEVLNLSKTTVLNVSKLQSKYTYYGRIQDLSKEGRHK